MRLPNSAHESRPWRIHAIVPHFTLDDVWTIPGVNGGIEDFQTAIAMAVSFDPANAESLPTRVLWRIRDRLGSWFDLGRISAPIDSGRGNAADKLPIPDTNTTSLADRLPDDLRNTAIDLDFRSLPFAPLYRTDVELAAELSNQTVHAVMHLAWVDKGPSVTVSPVASFATALVWLIFAISPSSDDLILSDPRRRAGLLPLV
jgi:hypothetical protein